MRKQGEHQLTAPSSAGSPACPGTLQPLLSFLTTVSDMPVCPFDFHAAASRSYFFFSCDRDL